MGILSSLFGSGTKNTEVKELIANGALIIDVRSSGEFQGGHVANSINIPLPSISAKLNEIKAKKKPVVVCCASGNRSGQAERILKNEGVDCLNGGSWMNVNACV